MSNFIDTVSLSPNSNKAFPIIDMWQSSVKPEVLRNCISSWIPLKHRRRLASYILLQSIYDNSHKNFIEREGILEYGDAALVVETLRDALIGSSGIKITATNMETDTKEALRIKRLQKWWKAELMDAKIFENETKCSVLGDSVYRLRWSNKNPKKPTVKVDTFDPGFFFPLFDDDNDLFKAHLAWEEMFVDGENEEIRVYKETYEMIEDICYVTAGWYNLNRTDCKSDNNYDLSDLELIEYKLDSNGNAFNLYSLNIDFIPLIYVPNVNIQGEPWGKSDLAIAIDLLQEVAMSNTDMAANTSLLGSPPMVVKSDSSYGDEDSSINTVGPGQVIEVGVGGDAHLLEVGEMNTALESYLKRLDQKLFENTRATKLAAGKMEGSAIPSGISLRLMQNPLVQKTLPKRLLRAHKLELMLKFVQKMFLKFGVTEDKALFINEDYETDIDFGDIFPTDRTQSINDLAVAYTGGFLSLETVVRMCMKIGLEIDDLKAEVARIKKEKEELNTFINMGTNKNGVVKTSAGKVDGTQTVGVKADGVQSSNMQATSDGNVKSDNKQVTE